MGKKRSAARRAATAAASATATVTPAVPFDTHAALVDTPSAPAVRESPTNTQQPRVSHEADAMCAPRAASPTHPPVDTTLVRKPATVDTCAENSVAIATPQEGVAHAFELCPEPHEPPPALPTPITSNDVSTISAHAFATPQRPLPALSGLAAAAAADLATAVARIGPPDLFITTPLHDFDQVDGRHPESETLAPRTSPATTIAEIDADLLANIIEDAQRAIRIEVRREVRVKALEEGRERGWNEGLEEGRREVRRAAREEARIEESQRERAWKDGYEQGRWDGYREGLDVARTEVSTSPRVDTSVQTDDAPRTPSPSDTSTTASHVDASVQSDAPPFPSPSPADSRPHVSPDTTPTTPRINAEIQTDDEAPCTTSTPTFACTTTPCIDPATTHVTTAAQTDDLASTRTMKHVDAGVQSDVPAPNMPAPIAFPSTPVADNTRASAHARARTVHEIEPDLLREILAAAIARGEAAGLRQGKHSGFRDGMEAGWKSGTKEGREEGYREGKEAGIEEGREQHRLEVRRVPRAIAIVQTDEILSTHTNPASQIPQSHIPTPSVHDNPVLYTTPHVSSNSHATTTFPDNFSKSHKDLSPPYNDPSLSYNDTDTSFTTAHTHIPSFSWADEACSLPTMTPAPLISPPPRDFSALRSISVRPFDSLKRRARRSQARPTYPSRPPRPFISSSEPIITRRHPAGLRADRPAVIISPSLPIPHLVKLDTPPLDWQGDPRLQELGRVLRGLGWVYGLGS